jgi:guanylate kinase
MSSINSYVYIICGAAGSGKTTLVNSLVSVDRDFEKAKKYSTRLRRNDDDDVLPVTEEEMNSGTFDLAYEAAGNRYALRISDINEQLEAGKNVIFPLTDIAAARRIQNMFGERAVTICVMSALNTENFLDLHTRRYGYEPSIDIKRYLKRAFDRLYSAARLQQWQDVFTLTKELVARWEDSLPERRDLEIRKRRVQEFQARYFENLGFFSYTILNYRDGHQEDMLAQFKAIVGDKVRRGRRSIGAPLFVVSGASGSGKGMLAATLRVLARHEIDIVEKEGKRSPKPSDKGDGMIAIGRDGRFSANNDFEFDSHREGSFAGTAYAFSRSKVRMNLSQGRPQYLVANTLTNPQLRKRILDEFGDSVVFLYLWRLQDEEQMIRYQKENCPTSEEATARIAGTLKMYEAYCDNPNLVDHVLLNTGFPESLGAQMFHLIRYYSFGD